jgi:hypothetical protein
MSIRLRYRQGALLREEPRYSEGDAIVRAGELMQSLNDCTNFEITNERGELLKSDPEIRRAYSSLWDNELELTPSR